MTLGHQCDEKASFAILDSAWEKGVNFIDTADVYPLPVSFSTVGATETIIGNWMHAHPGRRHEVILATKCNGKMGKPANDEGLSRRHILDAIDASLKHLKTDFIDLYQVHMFDARTPLEETLRTLDDLVRWGKVRYVGCSNYLAHQLAKALWISDKLNIARYDCIQPRYNLLFREFENELFPLCREEGVGVIVYNPLAGGFLTGKHNLEKGPEQGGRFDLGDAGNLYRGRYWHEEHFVAVQSMREFFKERGKPLTQVAIAWVLNQPVITSAIIGASKPEHLDESLPAVDMKLNDEELKFLDGIWYGLPRMRNPQFALR
jgi:aryl-alcohol dehydrogenase-like predicted oxidoreductase